MASVLSDGWIGYDFVHDVHVLSDRGVLGVMREREGRRFSAVMTFAKEQRGWTTLESSDSDSEV
jgi:hypothetical protein